jgi:hypothetical protein
LEPFVSREIRYILFDEADLTQAVARWSRERATPLPPGTVSRLALVDGVDGIEAHMTVTPDSRWEEPVIRHFGQTDLIEALIVYCRYRAIPLPQRMPKRLEIMGRSLGLLVSSDAIGQGPEVVDNQVRYDDETLSAVRDRADRSSRPQTDPDG